MSSSTYIFLLIGQISKLIIILPLTPHFVHGLNKWIKDLRDRIKEEWIKDMESLKITFPFFLWFPTFASKQGIPDVYTQHSLNVQTNLPKT